jgi:hypothetical protein
MFHCAGADFPEGQPEFTRHVHRMVNVTTTQHLEASKSGRYADAQGSHCHVFVTNLVEKEDGEN